MEPLNRNQAIWLARGATLGAILRRALLALRALVGQPRYVTCTHRGLPKSPSRRGL